MIPSEPAYWKRQRWLAPDWFADRKGTHSASTIAGAFSRSLPLRPLARFTRGPGKPLTIFNSVSSRSSHTMLGDGGRSDSRELKQADKAKK
eukprot:scaffold535_cov260-Pinguiococcus_pyrenoidosus.AAC.13